MNTFKFIGQAKSIQDTDKFKGYEEKEFDSGWMNRRVSFNMICGDNRHMVQITGGRWKDETKASVFIMTKGSRDEKGNYIKGVKKEVPWNERRDPETVENASRVFVVDLDTIAHREALRRATIDTATEEDLAAVGVTNKEEAEVKYKESLAKHVELISEWDFACAVQAVLASGKYNDKKFMVTGEYMFDFNPTTKKFYQRFNANKFCIMPDNAETSNVGTIDFYYTKYSVNEATDGMYIVDGFVRNYISQLKQQLAAPLSLRFGDPDNAKLTSRFVNIFSSVDEACFKKIRLDVEFIDGAQKVEITYDDLSDEQKDNIDCGLCDFETVKREMGGQIYGERTQYVLVKKLAVGSSRGAEDSGLSEVDFAIPVPQTEEDDSLDDIDDLFSGIEL